MSYTIDPAINKARGRLGGLLRAASPDPKAVRTAKQDLQYLLVRRDLCLALEAEPPLTHVQRKALVDLLLGVEL